MRSFPLLPIAAAALASCGVPGETNQSEVRNAAIALPPAPGQAAPKTAAPAGAAPVRAPSVLSGASAIPAAFQGVFDESKAACAGSGEARLEVSGGELRFHESIGTIRNVAIASPTEISVTADYQGEGESWHNVRTLKLSGDTLIISGDGTSLARIRCG